MAGWPAILVSLSNPGPRAVGVSLRPAQGGRPAPAESLAVALELLPVQPGPGRDCRPALTLALIRQGLGRFQERQGLGRLVRAAGLVSVAQCLGYLYNRSVRRGRGIHV